MTCPSETTVLPGGLLKLGALQCTERITGAESGSVQVLFDLKKKKEEDDKRHAD